MAVKTKSVAESHADHRHWHSDVTCWQDDIQNWKAEHVIAIEELQAALKRITEHGESLEAHAKSVAELEAGLSQHEKSLAESLKGGTESAVDETLDKQHLKQAELHQRQQEAHERIKKHHHTAMAQVAILKAALENAF